ncbi:MAG: lytic polysaccharide monooxygenase [Alphaproteobacteria bacterium]|nr:lytic polysaccharide monooxygenase [Alphaproteobacteria bacterium]
MLWTLSIAAFAHTALEYPPPRYPSNGSTANKACPCGIGDSNRLCDNPNDRSDPDRDDSRATTFESGETITVQFYETVGHSGRYRIAFDADGADMEDFNDWILLDVPDTAGSTGNVDGSQLWEFEVTLPDISCDNCTLQLVQMMDGNTTDPVPDPAGRSSYYQCADLVLVGGPPPDTDVPDTDVPDTDTDTDTTPPPDGSDSKCGCASSPWSAGPLALLGLAALARRRRD